VLIVVHAGTKSFSSPEKIEYVREQLEQFRLTIGKPIMCLHPDLSIESLNDEQLKKIGLQRIKD
jgi:hypothetical protein